MISKRKFLSNSANGSPIKLAATSTPGTAIHTTVTQADVWDELHIWVSNTNGIAQTLTLEWGGATDPDNLICKAVSIPANSGPTKIISGLMLRGGLTIKAFASLTNVLLITGYADEVLN